ncbi:MAG TPA: glycosyltransferase family 4 protein [Chitinophagaceae bacterium]|nr:glycosyltransferase family 4 protein [Chitinophagaceae bacterium]
MASKILWLCSWYPNDEYPYDGDFIQRHADAVSAYHEIDILYVHKLIGKKQLSNVQFRQRNKNLTEHIYINQVSNEGILSTLIGLVNYFLIHLRFIKKYGKPNLIHVQIPMKAGLVALYYKWFYKIPYIVTEHYGIYNPHLHDHFKTRNFIYRFATKLIMKYADTLTTVSHSLGEDINHWVLKKEFTVIPNVVDTNLFHYHPSQPKDRFQFIHISNMIPLKNVEGIIEAAELLYKQRQDFKLVFLGSISPQYQQLASTKNLLNTVIYFEGILPYNQVATKMKESDALIIFSDTESQSCVVLESLCSGRPAIVTNIGGVKELIDNDNGYKVNVRNTVDLADKMNEIINQYNQFNLEKISSEATNKYSYAQVGKQFSDCYEEVISKR